MAKIYNSLDIAKQQSDFILYSPNDGDVNVEVVLQNETIWLTQKAISELYGVQRPAITKHLKNIFDSGELQEDSVSSILEHTASDSKKYKTKFYNLDAIISVGYRVNSYQATQFRIWAITGKTAAEIVYDSADATKIHMGLTNWKHAPDGKIMKSDVSIAKNYISDFDKEVWRIREGKDEYK